MASKIDKFVVENYNTEIVDFMPTLSGIVKIDISFKINTKGEVSDFIAKGPNRLLEFEAVRVINSLPKMVPGQVNGKNVTVSYSLPIIFQVENNTKTKKQ
ncbi:MAG: energy transducer TonB [Flavobacteriaceae bacterium]|nr:energy transducer TonB [Flavobacteriaceae bacterium]